MRRTNAGIEAEPLAKRRSMLQQRRLTIGVAHRPLAVRLHLGDLPRQPRPLAERRHQHRIDVVETLPAVPPDPAVVIGSPAKTKTAASWLLGSGGL